MKEFIHHDARSVSEAVTFLAMYKGKARLNAGGTDLLSVLKDDILPQYPEAIINIKTIRDFDTVKEEDGKIRIGSLARLSDIANSSLVNKKIPILAEAALSIGNPQIRKMGTLGGNLCQEVRCWYYRYPRNIGGPIQCARKGKGTCLAVKGDNRYHAIMNAKRCFAVCPSDTAVALTALDASIVIAGTEKERVVGICDFFNPMGNELGPDEMVKEIVIPASTTRQKQVFLKFTLRKSIDFAVVSAATTLALEGNICADARIVLGAVAPGPVRAQTAETFLIGRIIDEDIASQVAERALAAAKPLSRNGYKIRIAKTLVKRALLRDLKETREGKV